MKRCPCCQASVAATEICCPVCMGRLDDVAVLVLVGGEPSASATLTAHAPAAVATLFAPPVPPAPPAPAAPAAPMAPSQVTAVPPFALLAPAPDLDLRAPVLEPVVHPEHVAPAVARPRLRGYVLRYVAVLLVGLLGAAYLASGMAPDVQARTAVKVGATGLVTDTPAGWAGAQESALPELRDGFLVTADGARPDGTVLTRGTARLAVLDVPNPAEMTVVPEFPATYGSVVVKAQRAWATPLGSARELHTTGTDQGRSVESRAVLVAHGSRLALVAVYAPGGLNADALAAYEYVRDHLRTTEGLGAAAQLPS